MCTQILIIKKAFRFYGGYVMSLYNILLIMIGIVGAIVGIGSTLAIIISLFGTIGYKIHRKIKYGISLYK